VNCRYPRQRIFDIEIRARKSHNSDATGLVPSPGCSLRRFVYSALAMTLVAAGACRHQALAPKSYVGFVANRGSNTVAVLDFATFRMVREISVPPHPVQLAVRPFSHEVWVLNHDASSIRVIAFPQLESQADVHFGPPVPAPIPRIDPASAPKTLRKLAFSSNGRHAFLLSSGDREIVFIDCDGRREIGRLRLDTLAPSTKPSPRSRSVKLAGTNTDPAPTDNLPQAEIVLTADGKTLIISHPADNKLNFVGIASHAVLGSVEVGKRPANLAVLPDSSKVFVADTAEEKISAVDIASRQVLSHLEIGVRPGAMLVKSDGGELFVLSPDSTLVIVDAFHDNVEQNFPLGRDPAVALLSANQGVLYVASAGDGSIMAIDVQNRRALSSTQLGGSPRSLALTPDNRFLAAADSGTSSLAVLRTDLTDDPASGPTHKDRSALVTTIPVGSDPVNVVIPGWVWERPHEAASATHTLVEK
jgi:YVTN family beta-propeller protein